LVISKIFGQWPKKQLQTTAHGPKPTREAILSGGKDVLVNNEE